MRIQIPYGREHVTIDLEPDRVQGVVRSRLDEYRPEKGERELIRDAMRHPIGSKPLSELARGKRRVVILASDHTRPVPSRLIIPAMLSEIRRGSPDARVTILVAAGCHRESIREELIQKFGEEIVEREKILIHRCDSAELTDLGTLPSGGPLRINSLAAAADLLVAEGFIEPHFFAGFSGGRKSVLPGIAGRETVYANHCAEFINDENSRCGKLEGNPIHRDMVFAARKAGLAYIVNVVINSMRQVIGAFAGDMEQAHKKGAKFLSALCGERAVTAGIVVTSNNGYPLDQNVYQAVKGLSTAERCVKKGGVIIMFAECEDGCGGEHFYRTFREADCAETVRKEIAAVPRDQTKPDQWQSQILARILCRCHVIFISSLAPEIIRGFHMIPAVDFEEALTKAERILGKPEKVLVIPEGITTMFE